MCLIRAFEGRLYCGKGAVNRVDADAQKVAKSSTKKGNLPQKCFRAALDAQGKGKKRGREEQAGEGADPAKAKKDEVVQKVSEQV